MIELALDAGNFLLALFGERAHKVLSNYLAAVANQMVNNQEEPIRDNVEYLQGQQADAVANAVKQIVG